MFHWSKHRYVVICVTMFPLNPLRLYGNRILRKLTISQALAIQSPGKWCTVYPKKYAHGFCFAVLCCGYTLTDFPISIRLTSPALWQSNDWPSASKATLMNMDKYFMWIHYERLRNHNKAKHNKTVCIFLGIDCICMEYAMCGKLCSNDKTLHFQSISLKVLAYMCDISL